MLAGISDCLAHTRQQCLIKRSSGSAGCGEADCLDAVIHAQMIHHIVLLAQAVGSVADHTCGNTEALNGFGVPEIRSGAKACLFFECKLGNKCFDIHENAPLFFFCQQVHR